MEKNIVIKGAREHNLKGIDVTLPRDKMIVLTGLSGSGKSSLAFDTIYAEGQKKYVESLSSYDCMFSIMLSMFWLVISRPHTGQCGIPILAYSSLR